MDNRIQKVLETANIKLGSVASDVLGVSGRKMIEGLLVDYFDKLNPQQRIRYHVRRLQELGLEVELSPMADTA